MGKRVVISGYYGFGNFGDEAILSVLVSKLKSLGCEIVVLSSNPRKTSMDLYVNSINSFSFSQIPGLIKHSEVLISGGGSLLQDVTSIKSLIYYLWIIFTAILYRKKVIIFAQGIGPINNTIARYITMLLLKKCTYISVRDDKSLDLLKSFGINADLVCDPIFSINLPIANNNGVVGVQLRDFSSMNDKLLNVLARQIVKEFSDRKLELYVFQKEIDTKICERFKVILKSINNNIDVEIVSDNIVNRFSNLEYLIGMRFHSLILAMKMGIKCLGINYDLKVEKLCEDANIPIVAMNSFENLDSVFSDMKNLNSNELFNYSNSRFFNWAGFENVLNL